MKSALAALALAVGLAGAAQAQVVIQAPGIAVVPPGGYWRRDGDWRRREEYREESRRIEWRREHCARDYYGHEFCRP